LLSATLNAFFSEEAGALALALPSGAAELAAGDAVSLLPHAATMTPTKTIMTTNAVHRNPRAFTIDTPPFFDVSFFWI
jgi:hypothetical protein